MNLAYVKLFLVSVDCLAAGLPFASRRQAGQSEIVAGPQEFPLIVTDAGNLLCCFEWSPRNSLLIR
jgi:hypothetical protein